MRLSVGEVLADGWALYTRNLPRLIALAAAVFGLLTLVDAVVDSLGTARWVLFPLSLVVTIVGVLWLQGALVAAAQDLRRGTDSFSLRGALRSVEPVLGTLLAAGLLAAAAIVIGLLAFLVPGVVLATYLSLVTPAVVVERRGVVDSFRRSIELVRRDALRVLVVIVFTIAIATMVSVVIAALLAPLPRFIDVYVAGVVANAITVPWVAVTWALVYFDLRTRDRFAPRASEHL